MASTLGWFAIPSSSRPRFVRTLHYDCLSWVALHGVAHSFTELHKSHRHDKAVIHEGALTIMKFIFLICKNEMSIYIIELFWVLSNIGDKH